MSKFDWIRVCRNDELRPLDVVELRVCATCGDIERFVLLADAGINVATSGACYTWRVNPVRCCRAAEIVKPRVCVTFKVAIERGLLFRRVPAVTKKTEMSRETRDAHN